jgi:hypothetical protein
VRASFYDGLIIRTHDRFRRASSVKFPASRAAMKKQVNAIQFFNGWAERCRARSPLTVILSRCFQREDRIKLSRL